MRFLLALLVSMFPIAGLAVESGSPAPEFKATTSDGKEVRLSDYKGKVVVLEWLNHGCPFVKKHYGAGNMQALQADYTKKGVVWLSVISSAKGKEGNVSAQQAEADRKTHDSKATSVLLDETGEVGKLFGAQTTPHMFVIDTKGKLAYQGAIDDKPSADVATIKGAKSYVRDAVDAVLDGKAVAKAQTKSYGCSVKY